MVLSNQAIKSMLKDQDLFIGLNPNDPYPIEKLKFDTTSIDLHLGDEFKVWKDTLPGEESIFDPSVEDFKLDEMTKIYVEDGFKQEDGSFILRSGRFVLATTKEYVKLPANVAARIEGRSKLGRLGVGIHVTAPTIHALFEGTITLEIYNHSPRAVKLLPWKSLDESGLRIGQIIFESVDGDIEANMATTYSGQTTALGS
jgi:dCTP deaminase